MPRLARRSGRGGDATATLTRSILVVEDDPGLADLMTAILQRDGFVVTVVRDAAGALAAVTTDAHDLVITDLWLNGVKSGASLVEQIREHDLEEPPILIVSGGSVADVTAAAAAHRNIAVLAKPFHITDLAATVREMVTPG